MDWTLLGECYSFVILLVLFIRYLFYRRTTMQNARSRLFVKCLLFSMCFIILNVTCTLCLRYVDFPSGVHTAINTVYFLSSIPLCSLFGYLLFDAVLEHVYDKHCLRRAQIMLMIVTVAATALTFINLFTGWVFRIDGNGVYHRGPINRVYYAFLLLEVVFLGICYFRNRKSVSDKVFTVVRCIPVIVILLCALQFLFPRVLFNGSFCALVSLVIFIAFRSTTEDYDALTGAKSRKAFMEELSLRTNNNQAVHLIEVSVRNMLEVNTRYSYAVGDAVLYEVARYLGRCAPKVQVFRTSGTTMTVLLPLVSEEEAEENLQTIIHRMRSLWKLGEIECHLTVAVAELRSTNLEGRGVEILEKLEYAKGLAEKDSSLVRYDGIIQEQLERRSATLKLIRRSIQERKFYVHYQPVYCCHRDLFCSAEALLRLKDEEGNPVSPAVFIPLAEESGMIEEMTWIVLEDVCRLLTSGVFPNLQYVTINLSMKQLQDPEMPRRIRAYLDEHNVAPERIKVEITERFLLYDTQYARQQMELLQTLGIDICMDDFGTGYSNLTNVLQFPFGFIKLDRSLIKPLTCNEHAVVMVTSLTKLFRDIGKRVVAEGVENEEEVALLRNIGVDMIQGFHFARPTSVDSLGRYFDEQA